MSDTNERKTYKFSDDFIALVRDLLQLSLLTNTNIIDHLRAVIVEPENTEARAHYLKLTPEYVEAYNLHIEELKSLELHIVFPLPFITEIYPSL